MDKRYQVFVSSTYEDLREERQEIMQALLELDCIPAGMELFPAANEDQWTLIKNVIDDCDYYMVVIGGRYGSIGPNEISYTQMEYEYAVSLHKPVIAFLHKDPSSIPAKKTEESPKGLKKLAEFRTLAQQKMCKYWSTPADLGSVVSRSLVKLIKTNPAIGWVKADLLPDESATKEILRLRQKIEDLENRLEETQQVSAIGTENLAQGEDFIELNYEFGAYKSSKYSADFEYQDSFKTTWNAIFFEISPLLIDEASDLGLKRVLDSYVWQVKQEFHSNKKELKDFTVKNFKLNENDFNTIKVQFLALKLIVKSTKRKTRSVSDKSAYWMLTPLGENLMMSLRAIRKTEKLENT